MPSRLVRNVADAARWAAHSRALESERPDALFRDPFARRLAGEHGRTIAERLARLSLNWVVPVRTRVFDELIGETIADGRIHTVLNLAAGLDTRPYRLALPASLRWVEVDLPALLATKQFALDAERPACRVERVPLDLADDAARKELLDRIGDDGGSVLVVTEGVLGSLDEASVAQLARELHARHAVKAWLLDTATGGPAQVRRGWGRTRSTTGPPSFAPVAGLEFFREVGWQPAAARSLTVEARRLGRETPIVSMARLVSTLTARGRGQWRRTSVCAVLEKA